MHATPRQILLGVFILGQLFFLFSSNLVGFLRDVRPEMTTAQRNIAEALAPGWPDGKGHAWMILDHLAKADRVWAELTGQTQTWSLFAPTIGRECVFPALELSWQDDQAPAPRAPELVLSDNEPVNPKDYFRAGNFRLRRYECNLVPALVPFTDETPAQTNARWRDAIRAHVADYAQTIRGYLRWRLDQIMSRRPGWALPRQVILIARRYHINDYAAAPPYWDGPFTVPLARWQTREKRDALEWYDPVDKSFKSTSK